MASSIFGFIIIIATGFVQLTNITIKLDSIFIYNRTIKIWISSFKMKAGDNSDEKSENNLTKREQYF